MKIDRISASFKRTVFPRKFRPVEIQLAAQATIDPDKESAKEARKRLYNILKNEVDAQCEKILDDENAKENGGDPKIGYKEKKKGN